MAKSDWDEDYKLPGNKKVYLSLFWCTNYTGNTYLESLDHAEMRLKEHGIGLDIYPQRHRVEKHVIDNGKDPIPESRYDEVRRKAHAIFDDQEEGSKIQRLPVFMCQFVYTAYGLTVLRNSESSWLPYCLIGMALDSDKSTVIHEVGHAAANNGAHMSQKGNIMNLASVPSRTIMVRAQIEMLGRSYFVR